MIHKTWFRVVLMVAMALIALIAIRLHVAAATTIAGPGSTTPHLPAGLPGASWYENLPRHIEREC